ncbi:sensor histidine kinase [Kribbella sp. DT2]|uniref:sensor histidine kinase n=1 Tax=Kribbella sp. DT2 TaxID=3393427 RepID=UPI003CF354AF
MTRLSWWWPPGRFGPAALLVAVLCALTDSAVLLRPSPALDGWKPIAALGALILVDLALALPPRWAGWVAAAHAVALVTSPLLLPDRAVAEPEMNNLGAWVAAFLAGAWLRTPAAVAALAALAAGGLVNQAVDDWPAVLVITGAGVLLPGLLGRLTTTRRTHLTELEHLTREREAAIQEAVANDRGAIARDLHDGLSHHMSAIAVHAGAARLNLSSDTKDQRAAVQQAVTAVETAGRSALLDLRRLLDLLHRPYDESDRQPGLQSLDTLLDGVRSAGLKVEAIVQGPQRELPASLDVALYRIVQEALTNALRHGSGDDAVVSLSYGSREIEVAVSNGLTGPGQWTAGRGLAGIRARAQVFGGDVSYGPDGSRWHLRVRLPVEQG